MSDWYYGCNGVQAGPISLASLQARAAAGQLQAGDLVWTEGMPAWAAASTIPGIFPAAVTPPPLPARAASIAYVAAPPPGSAAALGQDPAIRWLLPVGRSGWAIAAGYLGLFSLLIFPAPLALICSIIAIRDIRKHPQRHGMGRAVFALVMGILGSLLVGYMIFLSTWPHISQWF